MLYFNFGFAASSSAETFSHLFPDEVARGLQEAGAAYDPRRPPAGNFGHAIDALSAANEGRGVVVLIDEHDAPVAKLLHRLDSKEK